MSVTAEATPRLLGPGLVLGMGLGGFVDGIVLHQILQWHHMLSETERFSDDTIANLRINVLADGLFHLTTWILVAFGVSWLWVRLSRSGRTSPSCLIWPMAMGWGVFNLVEGSLNHHLLRLHRVNPRAAEPLVWDLGFLILGVALVVSGSYFYRPCRTNPRRISAVEQHGAPNSRDKSE